MSSSCCFSPNSATFLVLCSSARPYSMHPTWYAHGLVGIHPTQYAMYWLEYLPHSMQCIGWHTSHTVCNALFAIHTTRYAHALVGIYHTRHAHGLVIITERVSQRCFQRYKGEGVLVLILTNLVAMALGYSHPTERLWTLASSMFIGNKWSFYLWWERQILHYCTWHRKILLRHLFGAGSVECYQRHQCSKGLTLLLGKGVN